MINRLRLTPLPGPAAVGARLAGGWIWFSQVAVRAPDGGRHILPKDAAVAIYPEAMAPLGRLTAARTPLCGLDLTRPHLIAAMAAGAEPHMAVAMARAGAAIVEVDTPADATRAAAGLRAEGVAALVASSVALDDGLVRVPAQAAARTPPGASAVLALARGGDAMARVAALEKALEAAMLAGAPPRRLALDPGPLFGAGGREAARALAPLHATGCAVVADLTDAPSPAALGAGVALALASGAQLLRVGDVAAAAGAMALWMGVCA